MKEKKKLNQGITLIALVITIIVLLILAAVSIATLTGENGILTKATTAKDNTQKEEEKEQMRLAYATALANNSNNLEVVEEKLIEELQKLASIEEIEDPSYPITVIFSKTGNKYMITEKGEIIESGKEEVTQKPEEEWETLASQITAENYGDFIDYEMDLDGDGDTKDDWKIFYSENGRVFLIAVDYLDYTKNGEKLDFENTKLQKVFENQGGKYTLNWKKDVLPEIQSDGINNTLFKSTMYDITETTYSNRANAKCASALLNTNNWSKFVNTSYADYAIGSPTLEMWVDSWNAKGKIKNNNEYTILSVTVNSTVSIGYEINNSSTVSLAESGTNSDQTGYYDQLYFPHQDVANHSNNIEGNNDDGVGYWLASPFFGDIEHLGRSIPWR